MNNFPSRAYSHNITVSPHDIDELGHVNNVVYVRWVQEAAAAHWMAIAPEEMQANYRWVVLRHEIDYKAPAFLGETVTAYTWVENYDGARSQRRVVVCRGEMVLADACTTWCLLDAKSMRPKRVGDDISSVFFPKE